MTRARGHRCLIISLVLGSLFLNRVIAWTQQGGVVPQPHPSGANVLEIPLPPGTSHRYLGNWGGYAMRVSEKLGPGDKIPSSLPSSFLFDLTPSGQVAVHFNVRTQESEVPEPPGPPRSKAWQEGPDKTVVEVEWTVFDPTEGHSFRHVDHLSFQLLTSVSMKFDWFQGVYPAPDGTVIGSVRFRGTLGRITEARATELDRELQEVLPGPAYSSPIDAAP